MSASDLSQAQSPRSPTTKGPIHAGFLTKQGGGIKSWKKYCH